MTGIPYQQNLVRERSHICRKYSQTCESTTEERLELIAQGNRVKESAQRQREKEPRFLKAADGHRLTLLSPASTHKRMGTQSEFFLALTTKQWPERAYRHCHTSRAAGKERHVSNQHSRRRRAKVPEFLHARRSQQKQLKYRWPPESAESTAGKKDALDSLS